MRSVLIKKYLHLTLASKNKQTHIKTLQLLTPLSARELVKQRKELQAQITTTAQPFTTA